MIREAAVSSHSEGFGVEVWGGGGDEWVCGGPTLGVSIFFFFLADGAVVWACNGEGCVRGRKAGEADGRSAVRWEEKSFVPNPVSSRLRV